MKKSILLFLMTLSFSSCETVEERNFKKAEWKHKEKMLHLDYIERISRIKSHIKFEATMEELETLQSQSETR